MVVDFDQELRLIITEDVITELLKHKQTRSSNESGGVLLGKKDINDNTYYITNISRPSKFDISSLFSFVRSKDSAQRIINKSWQESGGVINYLGEWHTHCEITPSPSQTDKRLVKQIFKDQSNSFNHYFMIILGSEGGLFIGAIDSTRGDGFLYSKNIEEIDKYA